MLLILFFELLFSSHSFPLCFRFPSTTAGAEVAAAGGAAAASAATATATSAVASVGGQPGGAAAGLAAARLLRRRDIVVRPSALAAGLAREGVRGRRGGPLVAASSPLLPSPLPRGSCSSPPTRALTSLSLSPAAFSDVASPPRSSLTVTLAASPGGEAAEGVQRRAPATERRSPSAAVSRPAWFVTRGAVRSRGVGPDSVRTGLPNRTAVGRRPLAAVKID